MTGTFKRVSDHVFQASADATNTCNYRYALYGEGVRCGVTQEGHVPPEHEARAQLDDEGRPKGFERK